MSFFKKHREKIFGDGRPVPLNRDEKIQLMARARGLVRRTEAGKAYGVLTAKCLDVLQALLWQFHNARSGICFPSYETIAAAAGCARSTVGRALRALEKAGLLTWANRLKRVRVFCKDLFGNSKAEIKVIRTSNGYRFNAPRPQEKLQEKAQALVIASKSDFQSGTLNQEFSFSSKAVFQGQKVPSTVVEDALHRLGAAIGFPI